MSSDSKRSLRAVLFPLAMLFVAPLILALPGCRLERAGATDSAEVLEVIDGDTIRVKIDGREETLRLLGIDTPETKDPTTPIECYGPEASAQIEQLLPPGSKVRLERDVEPRDRYGRLLVYVWAEGEADDTEMINVQLAAGGFAKELSIAPNSAYAAQISAAVREARAQGLGLWGECNGQD